MKKILALALALTMSITAFAGCNNTPAESSKPADDSKTSSTQGGDPSTPAKPVDLKVATSYGGDDGNRPNYEKAYKDWETKTGNTVKDSSAKGDETWKTQMMADFKAGAEPDVLFFWNGADANSIVSEGKVISIDDIRKEYPEYASNMVDEKMGASPFDGKNYSVPVNGFWEALFVNQTVLDKAGVKMPGTDYTMEQFYEDCQKIKDAGYTPIAASMHEEPGYWFEYLVFNYLTPSTHYTLPTSADDDFGKAWVNGLNDEKAIYDKGFYPENTLSMSDDEAWLMFLDDKAAFAIDGSWKVDYIKDNYKGANSEGADRDLNNINVTFPPAIKGGSRKTTDLVAGISMGYYITKKAWDDPDKRAAAVSFVEYMTSDDVVASFCSAGNATALKNGLPEAGDTSVLIKKVNEMHKNCTGYTAGATQDNLDNTGVRTPFFDKVKNIVTGETDAKTEVEKVLQAQEEFLAAQGK